MTANSIEEFAPRLIGYINSAFTRKPKDPAYSAGGERDGWTVKSNDGRGRTKYVTVTCVREDLLRIVALDMWRKYSVYWRDGNTVVFAPPTTL